MLGSNVQKGLVAALALALAGSAAPAAAAGAAGPALGARGVEGVARRAAGQWGEKHPRRLEYTTAALQPAKEVVAGEAPAAPLAAPDSNAPAGDARSLVDVVVMRGHFTANLGPRGAKPPTGTVLELVIDAHTGAIEMRSLRNRVPVPLSRLGQVRRIALGGGPTRR
jgi:hypothetical protein